jgi:hypothetical protein
MLIIFLLLAAFYSTLWVENKKKLEANLIGKDET